MSEISATKPAVSAKVAMTLGEIYEELLTLESTTVILAENLEQREDETIHLARQLREMRKKLRRVYDAVESHEDPARASHD